MTAVYLIRHGQASFGHDNYDCLSDMGQQQAQILGKHLTPRVPKFEKAVRGSMLRHQQTTDGCLGTMPINMLKPTIDIDARWNEYDHQDILGQFNPELATAAGVKHFVSKQPDPHKTLNHIISQAFERWLNGKHDQDYIESWSSYQSRIHQALSDLVNQLQGEKNIVVFTSGGPISVVIMKLLNIPSDDLMKVNWNLVNCGVTKLICGRRGITLSSMNEHSAFEGEHRHLVTYK